MKMEVEAEIGAALPFAFKPQEACNVLRTYFPGIENGIKPSAEQMASGWAHVRDCQACLRNTIRMVAMRDGGVMLPIQVSKKQALRMAQLQGAKAPEGDKAN